MYLVGFPWWSNCKNSPSNSGHMGSIPGRGTRIPYAMKQHKSQSNWAPAPTREAWGPQQGKTLRATTKEQSRCNQDQVQPKKETHLFIDCHMILQIYSLRFHF